MGKPETKTIPLRDIRIDGETQSRVKLTTAVIDDYAAAYSNRADMPRLSVFFDGVEYWLADGFHRFFAAKQAEIKELPCDVYEGTVRDAQWHSYSSNTTHGLRRTNKDKIRAAKLAIEHPMGSPMSDRQIAEHVGVARRTIVRLRRLPPPQDGCDLVTTQAEDGNQPDPTEEARKPQEEREPCPQFEEELASPAPPLVDIDTLAAPYKDACAILQKMRTKFQALAKEAPAGAYVNRVIVRVERELKDLRNTFRQMTPVEACRVCDGLGCDRCSQTGFWIRMMVDSQKGS